MKNTIGFIGLGIMGKPMALNLLKAGYEVICHDINREPVDYLISKGAQGAASSARVAARCEIIITMLPNSPQVKEVITGKDGIMDSVKGGTIIVDMSSIDPMVSRELSKILEEKDVVLIDAPVSGGEPKAIDGTLSIMVGGPRDAFDKVEKILYAMGTSVVLTGEIGSGNVTKLANQIIVALNIAAMSEALVLAQKAGVDPEKVYNAIRGGLAGSTVLDAKAPMVLDGNFKPGFRIELHIKDLMNALNAADGVGAPIPLTKQVMEILESLRADGCGQDDHSGIIKYYEKLSETEVRRIKED